MAGNHNIRYNPVARTKIIDMDFINSNEKKVNRKLSLQKREPYIKKGLKIELFDVMIEEKIEGNDIIEVSSMILTRENMNKLKDEIDHLVSL